MSFAICTGEGSQAPHVPLELWAGSPNLDVPVLAEQGPGGYALTDRYVDGTKGVLENDMIDAECDDEPWCPMCRTIIDHWDHGVSA